ncbi:lithostathine-like [Ahaetulla prasina]|uniref:lithostathine-like n=1 Tax=Ahaetulla prasina TaxID=499056 RepID=UPI0026472294|nr:lithostathine-like [Ahaetulla prasina]
MGRQTFWAFCLLACLTGTSLAEGSPKIQARSKCPDQAVYYRLQCYHPIYMLLSWYEAEIECQHLRSGSHLATILTAAEEKIVSSHIRRSNSATNAWIGMNAVQEGKKLNWQWSDATTYTPGSLLWDNRAPSTTVSTSQCISVANIQTPGNAVRWIQQTCESVLPFICKYKASN